MRERMRALTFEVICRAVFGVAEPERVERLRAALLAVVDTAWAALHARTRCGATSGGSARGGWLQRRLRARRRADLRGDRPAPARARPRASAPTCSRCCCALATRTGRPMSDVELRDELMTMLAAGHETTATGLAFAFDLLLHHPERARAAARRARRAGDDAYLDAVATETLRLRPVIDAAERTLKAPRTIAGWELPAGIKVYPAIGLVHRREDLYPQAAEFRPERFLDGRTESYTWIPVRRRDPALHRRRPRPGGDERGPAGRGRARGAAGRCDRSSTRRCCAGSRSRRSTASRSRSSAGALGAVERPSAAAMGSEARRARWIVGRRRAGARVARRGSASGQDTLGKTTLEQRIVPGAGAGLPHPRARAGRGLRGPRGAGRHGPGRAARSAAARCSTSASSPTSSSPTRSRRRGSSSSTPARSAPPGGRGRRSTRRSTTR